MIQMENHGTLPVISLFTIGKNHPYYTRMIDFNMILITLAQKYNLPVVNLWRATGSLPNNGIGPDDIHFAESGTIRFTEQGLKFGQNMRNLEVLKCLDSLDKMLSS